MTTEPSRHGWRLLLRRIETHEELGCLLIMATEPDRVWTLEDLVATGRLTPEAARTCLDRLVESAVVGRPSDALLAWMLASDPATREAAVQLIAVHRNEVTEIVRAMTEDAIERVRTAALRTFADAFVLKRGERE